MNLAVIFPGIGYHVDKPLLYYSKKIAKEAGYTVIDVPYGNFPAGVKDSKQKMEEAFLSALEQAEKILEEIDFSEYNDILFISKSVGTAVASAYAGKHGIKTRNVYYTPVGESFLFMKQGGIVFHGTSDGWVDTEVVKVECDKSRYPLYITENGNHSLETGDALADLANLEEIMKITKEYIVDDQELKETEQLEQCESEKERSEQVCFMNMCMIQDDKGNVLVLDKVNDSYTGTTFPGGHVEKGEMFTKSIIREVWEETGLTIRNPILCGVYHWTIDEIRNVVFLYRTSEYEGNLHSSEEGKVYWIPEEDFLKKDLAVGMERVWRIVHSGEAGECYMHLEENGYVGTLL